MSQYQDLSPRELRQLIRSGEIDGPTAGLANGFAQANLVVVRKALAFDFLLFCQRNPQACPLLDVTDPGSPRPGRLAADGDIRSDLPRYRIYRNGELDREVTDISPYWEDDMVGFLIGCSFTFEQALLDNGIAVRHVEDRPNVPMYITNLPCTPAGSLAGPMVVSMRPVPAEQVVRAVQVTSRFPAVHGAPVHIGDPARIGIADLDRPDFGDPSRIGTGEVPVFWPCGVTPQAVAMHTRPDLVITHAPGHMFISDVRDSVLGIL